MFLLPHLIELLSLFCLLRNTYSSEISLQSCAIKYSFYRLLATCGDHFDWNSNNKKFDTRCPHFYSLFQVEIARFYVGVLAREGFLMLDMGFLSSTGFCWGELWLILYVSVIVGHLKGLIGGVISCNFVCNRLRYLYAIRRLVLMSTVNIFSISSR